MNIKVNKAQQDMYLERYRVIKKYKELKKIKIIIDILKKNIRDNLKRSNKKILVITRLEVIRQVE